MDPLKSDGVHIDASQDVKLKRGSKILGELEELVKRNEPLSDVLVAQTDVLQHFTALFPEVVQSNNVGKINKDDFKMWAKHNNDVSIELDPNPSSTETVEGMDVYIGGPAALTGAAIQARSGQDTNKVLYGQCGNIGASNWKGSASYFHIRDAVPVYYWPDNHGAYTLYATIKHFLQRNFQPQQYIEQVEDNPGWNKLRFHFTSFFKEPSLTWLFMKNQWRALNDVGLHIPGTALSKPTDSTAYVTCTHASLTHQILKELNSPKPLIMKSDDLHYALYTYLGGEKDIKMTLKAIHNIAESAGEDLLNHRYLTKDEISDRGYDPAFVKKAAVFENDGYFPLYINDVMSEMVSEAGGQVLDNMQLLKILVKPINNGDTTVTKIVWRDTKTGRENITPIKSLHLSLGPSMRNLTVKQPPYSFLQHTQDILGVKLGLTEEHSVTGFNNEPTIRSLVSNILNKIKPSNMMSKIMFASGTSIVFMVKVDKSVVTDAKMNRFRDHIDGHNKHIVRLAEKEVCVGDKAYQYFVLQTTGGGHFPIKDAHAETGLNVFKANVVPILNLDAEGIEYDIIQARSCARGITSQNVFRMSAPAANMVMVYGIGGIGMTTMAPNALLMKAIMGMRQKVAVGKMSVNEFKHQLKTGDFSEIPHWTPPNPFGRNYAQFIDFVNNPKEIGKRLGISASWYEKVLKRTGSSEHSPTFEHSSAFKPSKNFLQHKTPYANVVRRIQTLSKYFKK